MSPWPAVKGYCSSALGCTALRSGIVPSPASVSVQSIALQRSFAVMHTIDEKSPLFGSTPESWLESEIELLVSVVGTDDTSLQPVNGRHRYLPSDVLWGSRLADVLKERPDGKLELDVRKFHDTVMMEPTESFPYPRKAA